MVSLSPRVLRVVSLPVRGHDGALLSALPVAPQRVALISRWSMYFLARGSVRLFNLLIVKLVRSVPSRCLAASRRVRVQTWRKWENVGILISKGNFP